MTVHIDAETFLNSDRGMLIVAQALYMAHRALRAKGEEGNADDMVYLLENHPKLRAHLGLFEYTEEYQRNTRKGGPLKAVSKEGEEVT